VIFLPDVFCGKPDTSWSRSRERLQLSWGWRVAHATISDEFGRIVGKFRLIAVMAMCQTSAICIPLLRPSQRKITA